MPESITPHNPETNQQVSVRQLQAEDIAQLQPIIEKWVRDPETGSPISEEITEIRGNMESSLNGTSSERQYLVAEKDGEVVGVMGLAFPSELIKKFARTDHPIEIVNAFVADSARSQGVGGQLLDNVEGIARFIGASEVLVNSGPRYKDTAWNFYDKKFDGRQATLKDYYGPGNDAPVWGHVL